MPAQKASFTVVKLPRDKPFVDKNFGDAWFTRKMADGNWTSLLHLEMLEDTAKVKPGAPAALPIPRQVSESQTTQAKDPKVKESKTKESKSKRKKHGDKHRKEKPPKEPKAAKSQDPLPDDGKSQIQRDMEFLMKSKKPVKDELLSGSEPELTSGDMVTSPHVGSKSGSTSDLSSASQEEDDAGSQSQSHSKSSKSSKSSRSTKSSKSSRSSKSSNASASGSSASQSETSEAEPKVVPLTPEQERSINLRKIAMWKKSYPMKPIPDFDEMSDPMRLKQFVSDFERNLRMDTSIGMYTMGLRWGFIGMENVMVNRLGMDSMRGYAGFHDGLVESTYHPYIVEMSNESAMMLWFQALTPDMKLLMTIMFQSIYFYMFAGRGGQSSGTEQHQSQAAPPRRMQGPSVQLTDIPT